MIYKNFSVYTPDEIPDALVEAKVIFLRDDAGNDWYEIREKLDSDKIHVLFNDTGMVCSYSRNASDLWPVGLNFATAENNPEGLTLNGQWVFNTKLMEIEPRIPTHDEIIAAAEYQKKSLMAAAMSAIGPLQDAVELDIATDEEVKLLKAWKKYRVLLNRVDTSAAPDIEWPKPPATI